MSPRQPTQELGDLFEIWTPSEIRNYVDNVAAAFSALEADYYKHTLDEASNKAWRLLLANFTAFRASVGFFSTLSLGTLRTAEEYAKQLQHWRTVYESKTGQQATGAVVSIPAQAQMGVMKGAAALAALGCLTWLGVNMLQTFRNR